MFYPVRSGKFKRDYKLYIKRDYDMALIDEAITTLCKTGTLPSEYFPHPLKGNYGGCFEAHIQQDWLIIWYIDLNSETPGFEGALNFVRTGTHSDLFKK
jgi:mRNA interferase YafQ